MENEVIIDLTKGPRLLTKIFHEYAKLSEEDTFAEICLYDFLTSHISLKRTTSLSVIKGNSNYCLFRNEIQL